MGVSGTVEVTKELKTNVLSAAAGKTHVLALLRGVRATRSLIQRVGAALRNDLAPEYFLFVSFDA